MPLVLVNLFYVFEVSRLETAPSNDDVPLKGVEGESPQVYYGKYEEETAEAE